MPFHQKNPLGLDVITGKLDFVLRNFDCFLTLVINPSTVDSEDAIGNTESFSHSPLNLRGSATF